MDLSDRKARMRAGLAARRRGVAGEAAAAAAGAVAGHLAASPLLASCRRLAVYAAVDGELCCDPIVAVAEQRALPVLFPRVVGEGLEFAVCQPSGLVRGSFDVPAPPASLPHEPLVREDLVIAPALAFDAAGRRLGRGGGHYDRAFADARVAAASIRVCVGYDFQRVAEVPAGPQDQRVHWLVTEAGIWRTSEGSLVERGRG